MTPIKWFEEVMNCEEAADFLGIKPFTVRTYARRGVIPGKQSGDDWSFVRADLLAWLRGVASEVVNLETALMGAKGFVQRMRLDSQFKQNVEKLSNHAELMAFARQEGFAFTFQELQAALKINLGEGSAKGKQAKIPRRAQRYQVCIEVSELNGQPITDTMILDINAWGARIGSFKPFDTPGPIEITFNPPSETQNVHLVGQVVWSRLVPTVKQYQAGVEFTKPIDQLLRKGEI